MNERKKKLKRFLVSFLPLKNFLFSFFDHRDLRYKLSVRYTYQTPGKKKADHQTSNNHHHHQRQQQQQQKQS